ncbi:MAG TPA: carboxypeptidase regulatory-like domain-containing protein, partial [Candidatus Desulfaltia sp.]|nr:carboxypeptidase regulatory-like domain-containing protein [Candidatus Desulfaltia sp.]
SVDAMSYTLTVSKQGYQTSTPLRVTVGPGETQNIQVTITESAATITGRVTDAKRGNPISGATVRADSGQATTNYAGYFSLSVKAGTYTLTLSKQGYQTSTTQVKVDPGENQSVVFTLTESTATITGRVTDAETGDPVSGATITAGSEQTTTDSGGSFSLGVDATSYTLTVSKQGYQTSTPLRVTVGPGETQNVIITLTKSTATINGRVTDAESGDPVRGVTVTTDGGQTTTDTDGSFSLSVVVGTHTLTLRKEGYDTNTLQVNVSPGETKDVHATLSESSSTITGTVTDAKTGNPINGATIKVNGEQATTDSGGSFSLSVKAGTYTMTITQQGYKTSTNPITVDPGTTKNVPMIISSAGLPLVPIAAGIGGIVIVAIVAYLKTRKPVERVPKPYALRITAEPIKLPADGTSTSNIIVELINEEGDPIRATEDVKVVLSTSTGSITSPLTISEGETTGTSTLRSSLETGNVKVLAESKGLKGASISLAFTERKRYCMHCGAQMSIADPVCPNCRQMPPSGVDVKQCPNCAEIMPSIAKFCGKCGARQQTRQ